MNKLLAIISFVILLTGCEKQPTAKTIAVPERIVSLAPNITETIYALGLGDKLVGSTTACTYPEAAKLIPRVGGFGQFNYESIIALKPDLVILHKEYDAEKKQLKGLGVPYLETSSYFISDILKTIRDIGTACGVEKEATAMIQELKNRISELEHKTENRPRVLMVFGGTTDKTIEQIHAFGTECLHHELLEIAGGQNVIDGKLPFASLSKEAVFRLNPDIIIQLAPEAKPIDDPASAWREFASVSAVKNGRVYLFTGNYTCIPGPRFIQILEDFSRIIGQDD